MSQDNLHQHLVNNVPNVEEFRDFVKQINKMARKSNSIWQLSIRYRKPKEGHKYGYGGNLRCENANAFCVYVHDRSSYNQIPENQYRSKLWEAIRKLEEENENLKKQLATYKNPYIDWSVSSIEDEIYEIKDKIVDRFLECDDDKELLRNQELKEQYDQLMEALEYAEKSD